LDGGDNLVNDLRSPRFGKVGDAFDEGSHGIFDLRFSILDLGLTIVIIKGERKRE
jgi:hypothetical protein